MDLDRVTQILKFEQGFKSKVSHATMRFASRFKPPRSLCSLTTQKDKLLIKLKMKLPKLFIPHHMAESQLTGSSFLQHTRLISLSRLMRDL